MTQARSLATDCQSPGGPGLSPLSRMKANVDLDLTSVICLLTILIKTAFSYCPASCVCNAGWAGSSCEEENEIVIGALYKTNNLESFQLQVVHAAVHRVNAAAGFFATPTNLRVVVVDLSPIRAAAPQSATRFNAAQHAAQRLSEAGAVAAVGSPYSSDSMSLAAPR